MDPLAHLELSRLERDDQGTHETEVSHGGRDDLQIIKDTCGKNPGHSKFIFLQNLSLYHLPEEYQNEEVLEMVKLYARLTVCLFVNYISPDRPSKCPDSDDPYPFSSKRGSTSTRVGTGSIELIHDYDQSSTNITCFCKECKNSDNPKRVWGKIMIQTAKHVIFDEEEGKHTVVELFYDSENREHVYTLQGNVIDTNIESDWCLIYCPTHDMELVIKLQEYQHRFLKLRKIIYDRYKPNKPDLVVIASHPHGCCKHISIGRRKLREEMGDPKYTRYSYTTATCPGCSGARVWILAEYHDCQWACHIHSEGLGVENNRSGVAWY